MARLQAIVNDRNSTRETVWRAEIVLATADGHGTNEIMRRAGMSKPTVWRWQERYIDEGVDGLLAFCRTHRIQPGTKVVILSIDRGQSLDVRHKEDRFEILDSDAIPLGMFPTIEIAPPTPIELEPGDLFAVLSDGFFEAKNPAGEEQETAPICEVIRRYRSAPCSEIMEHIREATESFTEGAPPDDDRTILLIKRT